MKKITFLIGIIAIIITGLGVYSCQKIEENNKQDIQEGRVLTNEQIELIGVKHNEYLKIMLENNRYSKNKQQGLIEQKNILEKQIIKNVKYYTSKPSDSTKKINTLDENIKVIKSSLSDRNNFIYFEKILNFLKENNKRDVESISDFLNDIKQEMVNKQVNVRDYETILVFSSVLKNSAKFWLPKKLGGLDNYAYYKENLSLQKFIVQANSESDGWRDCLEDVLVADGMSASAGFIVGAGITAASGGTAGPLVILGIAIESGATSAWEYYRSSNC